MAATAIIAITAVAVALAYFQDRRSPRQADYGVEYPEDVQTLDDWEEASQRGIRVGSANAQVVITEFVDFQCPYCADLAPTVDSVLSEFPHEVAIVFQHFPLSSIHEYAVPAAVAAECADRQGRFWAMHQALFARQPSLGAEPWESFAEEAGVPNIPEFSTCVSMPADSFPRIGYGRSLGERAGITGTPTTFINGRRTRDLSVERVRAALQ